MEIVPKKDCALRAIIWPRLSQLRAAGRDLSVIRRPQSAVRNPLLRPLHYFPREFRHLCPCCGIHVLSVNIDAEVQMRARGETGAASARNLIRSSDQFATTDEDGVEVEIGGNHALPVIEYERLARKRIVAYIRD